MKGIFNKLFLREETKLYLNAIQYLEYKEKPPGNKFPRRLFLARIFHKLPAATMDMAFLPGVLECSFDPFDRLRAGRLPETTLGTGRTGSPCDVPFRYASDPTPCGCKGQAYTAESTK